MQPGNPQSSLAHINPGNHSTQRGHGLGQNPPAAARIQHGHGTAGSCAGAGREGVRLRRLALGLLVASLRAAPAASATSTSQRLAERGPSTFAVGLAFTVMSPFKLAWGAASDRTGYDRTDLAVFLFAAAALAHALIPVLLQYFGSDWKPARSRRSIAA